LVITINRLDDTYTSERARTHTMNTSLCLVSRVVRIKIVVRTARHKENLTIIVGRAEDEREREKTAYTINRTANQSNGANQGSPFIDYHYPTYQRAFDSVADAP
jgi:hypothetical protein